MAASTRFLEFLTPCLYGTLPHPAFVRSDHLLPASGAKVNIPLARLRERMAEGRVRDGG
jgi:hypothetical protein